MIVRAFGAGKRGGAAGAADDRDAQGVLAVLGRRDLTVPAVCDQGIEAAANAIYGRQFVGYTIDSEPIHHPNGDTSRPYLLRTAAEETHAGRPFPDGGTR